MYGHILATLALAEAHGMSNPDAYGKPAQKAVDFLLAAQNPGKGWRYGAKSGDNDTSVTSWAVMALRSAERVGLMFPKSAYEGALAWFDCRVFARYDAGDRLFFWADVVGGSRRGHEAADALREHEFIQRLTAQQRQTLVADRTNDASLNGPNHEKWRLKYPW
jgi:flavin reductase (DIM6/NTAB) family NADH-FMN oxidoreductase RutF